MNKTAAIALCLVFTLFAAPASYGAAKNAGTANRLEFKIELNGPSVIGEPIDVAVDEFGNFYVTDGDTSSIRVFDKDGMSKGIFNLRRKEEGWQIKSPFGIVYHSGKLYVTDRSSGGVFILTSKECNLVDSFGSSGSGPKEFKNPSGITVARGQVYVADTGNKRIQVFGLDGIYMGSIGEKDMLNEPLDVAVNHQGYIFVADGDKIKIFNPAWRIDSTLHNVKKPTSIITDKTGFFVADNEIFQIRKSDFKGNTSFAFGSEGKGQQQFRRISGIAMSPDGRFGVIDTKKNSLQIFHLKPDNPAIEEAPLPTTVSWLRELPLKADKILWDGKSRLYYIDRDQNSISYVEDERVNTFFNDKTNGWRKPVSMDIDSDGFLWLADTKDDRIIKLDNNGKILVAVGSGGSKKGYLSSPLDVKVSGNGILYVADTGNLRVQSFNKDGLFLNVIDKNYNGEDYFKKPIALDFDRADNVYILDSKLFKIFVFDSTGKHLFSFGSEGKGPSQFDNPLDIKVTATEIFVLDAGNQRVQVFDAKGAYKRQFASKGKGKGEFITPSAFTMKDHTEMMISDRETEKVQIVKLIQTPRPPANLRAEGSMRVVELKWEKNPEEFIDRYRVFRSEDNMTFREIGSTASNVFIDKGAHPEKLYYYKVSAIARSGNESSRSNSANGSAAKYVPTHPPWHAVTPGERDVTITWQNAPESFIAYYAIYREAEGGKFTLLSKEKNAPFIDRKVRPSTAYVYKLVSVSSDGVESDPIIIKITTLKQTRPPVELSANNIAPIFSNNYKSYEKDPIGTVRVTNNTIDPISRLKISFMIKEFMDYPTEREIENLKPNETVEVPIFALFNNKLLDMTENSALQGELKIIHYEGGEMITYTSNAPVMLYEKHALTWNIRDKVGTFVTPRDPIVLEFARDVARQYTEGSSDPVMYARSVFDAMSTMGMRYMPDPSNPYQAVSEKADQIDYVQYPRETLSRRTGDCDDLVTLYSAALESLGIQTALLDVPGHIFMMFNTGLGKDAIEGDMLKDMFVIYNDQVWIPVEVTLVGNSFLNAWRKGISTYNEWRNRGLVVVDIRKSWDKYKPATLQATNERASHIKRSDIEEKFGDEMQYIKNMRVRYQSKKYINALNTNPADENALIQLGIIYSDADLDKSVDFFKKVVSLDANSSAGYNNLGNALFLQDKFDDAIAAYEKAANLSPEDAHILVNLARAYLKTNQKFKAKKTFDRAVSINPAVSSIYQSIAFQLADPSLLLGNPDERK